MAAANPGILSIASYCESKGFGVSILDLSQSADFDALASAVDDLRPKVAGISCTSGFEYLESLHCASIVRQNSPDTLLLIGGQHAGPLADIPLRESSAIDMVVLSEGEWVVEQILRQVKRGEAPVGLPGTAFRAQNEDIVTNRTYPPIIALDDLPFFNFTLYPSFRSFTPYVEESRGCARQCAYCSSTLVNNGAIRRKSPRRFQAELEHVASLFGTTPVYAILNSTFGEHPKDTVSMCDAMQTVGIQWTTNFRADSPWSAWLESAYNAGLRIPSIGVESASPAILQLMNKTRDPKRYLGLMDEFLGAKVAYPDMTLGINVMFYAGESPSTIRETLSFLARNADRIDAVKCSVAFVIRGTRLHKHIAEYERDYGTRLIRDGYWERVHLYPIHPSKYFSHRELTSLGNTIEKVYSNPESWYIVEMTEYAQDDNRALTADRLKTLRFSATD